jgi:hypothetical protein
MKPRLAQNLAGDGNIRVDQFRVTPRLFPAEFANMTHIRGFRITSLAASG